MINSQGQVQLNRKEEIKSNIPGLKNRILEEKGEGKGTMQPVQTRTLLQGQRNFLDEYISQKNELLREIEIMDQNF